MVGQRIALFLGDSKGPLFLCFMNVYIKIERIESF